MPFLDTANSLKINGFNFNFQHFSLCYITDYYFNAGLSLFNNWKQQTGSSSNRNVDPAYIYPQEHTPAPSEDYLTDGYPQPELLASKALKINGAITHCCNANNNTLCVANSNNYEEADGLDNCLKKRVPFEGSSAFYSSTIDESGGQQAVCFEHSTDSSSSTANETTHLENSLTFPGILL